MLTEINTPLSGEYRTGGDWEPVVFHMDALMDGKQLDLILGYFSSSAISTFVCGFAKFISNGGGSKPYLFRKRYGLYFEVASN